MDATQFLHLGEDALTAIHQAVVSRLPDLTLLFDLPAELGLERAAARGAADRFEQKGLGYHQGVREAFLAIAEAEPQRVVIVDAAKSVDEVTIAVAKAVHERLPCLLGTGHGSPSPRS